MKILFIAFFIGISAYLVLGNTVGEQDATQIESRFGWSDVKETAKSTKDGFVAGAHKVGGWISEKAVKAKDNVISGYDYLKKKIKPKNENSNDESIPENTTNGRIKFKREGNECIYCIFSLF
jgi:hypothetical protein